MAPPGDGTVRLLNFDSSEAASLCGARFEYLAGAYSNYEYCLTYSIVWRNLLTVQMLPNPTDEHMQLRIQPSSGSSEVRIIVANSFGRAILDESLAVADSQSLNLEYDTSAWPPGVYFVRVHSGGQTHRLKLQVVH